MDATNRKRLEAAGYKVYDHAGDAVGMTEEEKELLDMRVKLALSVRSRREELHLSQQALAIRLKTTQPRIAKIEQAAPDVSLDQIFRAYAAMGGRLVMKHAANIPQAKGPAVSPRKTAEGSAKKKKFKIAQ